MRTGSFLCAPMVVLVSPLAFAYLGPIPGTENIPKLIADSTLVCKGEVIEAPEVTFSSDPQPPHRTATAIVHVDQCFKGERPASEVVPVWFDNILPPGGGPYVVLRKGDYRLFFLKSEKDRYVLVDDWFGQLSISRQLGRKSRLEDTDPMHRLEVDLKAGLNDRDYERRLDSIRMLGNMKLLRSNAELRSLLESADLLEQTFVWEALLKLKDYSVLPAVARFFSTQPETPPVIILPRDRLFFMEGNLVGQIGLLRDSSALPFLKQFASSPKWNVRWEALQALRAISDPRSAPVFLKALNDENPQNGFVAMMSLIELAGGGPIDWVPTWPQFTFLQSYYATKCREWWQEVGRKQMRHLANNLGTSRFPAPIREMLPGMRRTATSAVYCNLNCEWLDYGPCGSRRARLCSVARP